MSDIFTTDTTLQEGDVALIIRNNGVISLASAVTPAMIESALHQRRILSHQLMITACFRMCVDDGYANQLIQIGSDPDTIGMFADQA